ADPRRAALRQPDVLRLEPGGVRDPADPGHHRRPASAVGQHVHPGGGEHELRDGSGAGNRADDDGDGGHVHVAALLARGAGQVSAVGTHAAAGAVASGRHRSRWLSARRLGDVIAHGYVILILIIFVLPFLALLDYSMQKGQGYDPVGNYSYVFFGTFKQNLLLSLEVTFSAIVLNTLIAVPAAYGIVRYQFPGKRSILALLNLPLYTPA